MVKKIVVLTGAGVSAESGVATFRGAAGLWEGHKIEEVASPEGWHANPELVLDFYNKRRKNVHEVEPNEAHYILAQLEQANNVQIITQNIDNLHERAGSSNILHLHGEITKSRSTSDPNLVYEIEGTELNVGDLCEKGSQLRPHIVWFGEAVPTIETAAYIMSTADEVIIIGTSMQVYPAAGLVHYAPEGAPILVIDPNAPAVSVPNVTYYQCGAVEGMKRFLEQKKI
ncbi:MAG: NAD-dependent deacylase [Flavobacteriales bacterium]